MTYLHRMYTDGAYEVEGVAVVARWPVVSRRHAALSRAQPPDVADEHQRVCAAAVVATPAADVTVLTTHLSLSDRSREENAREIWKFSQQLPLPQLLCGDFNSGPGGNAVTFLTGHAGLDPETGLVPGLARTPRTPRTRAHTARAHTTTTADFVDAWNTSHGIPHGAPSSLPEPTLGLTFSRADDALCKRIDFMLIRGGLHPSGKLAVVGHEGKITTDEGKAVPPSDHMALVGSFVFG
eukprot:TRINITY_DN1135_c0_g1_i3.p1 TRINITY_DN1135_c0_g1~~TRINITY_DN1135_c0_g1_i3.p1  ORF type:complete len:238 (-),score=62.83 TRINITY_DN1135_c0_g1_i3:42-755(-)